MSVERKWAMAREVVRSEDPNGYDGEKVKEYAPNMLKER
jgi:hypothetical protein